MTQIHMTEAEAARDFHAVLERVRDGVEVVIEEGHRRIALIKPVEGPGRSIDECIAMLSAREAYTGSPLVDVDEEFANDIEKIIAERRPLDTSAWE
jgi:antitoxin (DNA-binding transcriptional repressor) of toxin-antitoxin stability system